VIVTFLPLYLFLDPMGCERERRTEIGERERRVEDRVGSGQERVEGESDSENKGGDEERVTGNRVGVIAEQYRGGLAGGKWSISHK